MISIGLWHNFGDVDDINVSRQMLRTAFDLGITHFDLANNYGPPFGAAEENFGKLFKKDWKPYRDELIISSKAGWDMWPGPALHSIVQQGKALYVGISQYSATDTAKAYKILKEMGTPLLIHQPRYSMMDRWVEKGLTNTLGKLGVGAIAFSPLEQGILTSKYLKGFPKNSRAIKDGRYLSKDHISKSLIAKIKKLNDIAAKRNQSMAQMAISWLLKDERITSILVGVSSPKQLIENVGSLENLKFSKRELAAIEKILK